MLPFGIFLVSCWQDYSLAVTVFESIIAKDPSCTFSLLSGIGRIYLQVNYIIQEICVYAAMKCDACVEKISTDSRQSEAVEQFNRGFNHFGGR